MPSQHDFQDQHHGRFNQLVDSLVIEMDRLEHRAENTKTPINLDSLKVLQEKLNSLIQGIEVDFNNQDILIHHENFENC